jgi:hypothetical protein
MSNTSNNIGLSEIRRTILKWLQSRLEGEKQEWIESKSNHLDKNGEDWEFFVAFSAVPRYTGKDQLNLTEQEKEEAKEIHPGWQPATWSIDQFGRALLLLSMARSSKQEKFLNILEKTFLSSDEGEAVALYKSLPVLPYPEKLKDRAAEGLRSSMTSVFNAVALHNPYPAEYFGDGAWNQLVLKALFEGSPLYKIEGIDRRRNEKLAEMLVDYAHERWAAYRSVSPELWRPVGPYAESEVLKDLQKVLASSDNIQKQAALLALSESPAEKAQALIEDHKSFQKNADWDTIGRNYNDRD